MPGEESHANEGRRTTKAYDPRQLGLDCQCLADWGAEGRVGSFFSGRMYGTPF